MYEIDKKDLRHIAGKKGCNYLICKSLLWLETDRERG